MRDGAPVPRPRAAPRRAQLAVPSRPLRRARRSRAHSPAAGSAPCEYLPPLSMRHRGEGTAARAPGPLPCVRWPSRCRPAASRNAPTPSAARPAAVAPRAASSASLCSSTEASEYDGWAQVRKHALTSTNCVRYVRIVPVNAHAPVGRSFGGRPANARRWGCELRIARAPLRIDAYPRTTTARGLLRAVTRCCTPSSNTHAWMIAHAAAESPSRTCLALGVGVSVRDGAQHQLRRSRGRRQDITNRR